MVSSAQQSALAKARAAARQKHPRGAQTPSQLAAERANLVKARSVLSTGGRSRSPAQIAAGRTNLAKARSVERARHGKGHQTAKQLAAERRNLAKARTRHHHHGLHHAKAKLHAKYGGQKALKLGLRPLGTHRINSSNVHKLSIRKPTGINKRFTGRIAPTSFDQRGSWKRSHTHHMQHRLHARKKRLTHLNHWRKRKGRLTPR